MKIINIKLERSGERYAIIGDDLDGAHYHIWLRDGLKVESDVVYKNPLQAPGDHRHRTRQLSQSIGMGKTVAAQLLAAAPGLLPACLAEYEAKEAKEKEARRVAVAKNQAMNAGPALLEALQGLLKIYAPGTETASAQPYYGSGTDRDIAAKWEEARALVATTVAA